MSPTLLRWIFNLWPPFAASGIHVTGISRDWRHAQVELRMRAWNRNYVRTHYGGNLFSMTDPFWMIMTLQSLGRDYIVWDQAGSIDFLKPGKGTVVADFRLDDAVLDTMRAATAEGGRYLHWFQTDILDGQGDVVARVRKQVYVRRKRDR
ncbi:DUF4442 domain-containing protein [uncultured Luteimonas sp.]|uniref:DUF4442 domain-containing protein n=1 Tax=uncultured Luteimonas sp. TaxID=453144 RepID=UPI00261F5AAB|nr:DUF4442 domain-containing protein [uncultured Luteimonas sp.]